MYTFTSLDIRGHQTEPVPNTFMRQEGAAEHIALALPGIGYTCQMPLLYYPSRLLLDRGADVLWVEYAYNKRPGYRALSEPERQRLILDDVTAACRAALGQRPYKHITVIGKSLGTLAMGGLLTSEPALASARAVWLTPLLGVERLRAQINQARPRSLFVIGTADPYYNTAYLDEVRVATGGEAVVVEGADHSLEIAGDIKRSLRAMDQVVRAVQAFTKEGTRRKKPA